MRQFNLFRSFWIVPALAILAIILVSIVWSHQSSTDYVNNFAQSLRQNARSLGLPLQTRLQSGQLKLENNDGSLRQFLAGINPNPDQHYDLYDQKGAYLLSLPLDRPRPLTPVPTNILLDWLNQDKGIVEIPGPMPDQSALAVIWAPTDRAFILLTSRPVEEADQELTQLRLRMLTLTLCLIALILVISFWAHSFISRLEEDLARQREASSLNADTSDLKKRTQFLAMMSHELRTPLTSVVGFSRLLSQQDLSAEANHYLRLIDESAAQLMKIIDDILDFSKLDSGQAQRTDSLLVLQPFLHSLTEIARLFIGQKPVEIDLSIDAALPASVYVDSSKLRQILQIFLTNAAKYTAQGTIMIEASYNAPNLIIRVKDSGSGIPESKLKSLFDPFQQADHDQAMRDRGTGLGLAIAKRLADLLGGSIAITSLYGSSTTSELILPVTTPASESIVANEPSPESKAAQRQLRILIADDSSSSRLLLQIILSKRGHQVETVDNGEDAFEAIKQANFDLVILDMQMPRMGGLECSRAIRTLASSQQPLRLVALTAQTFDEDKRAAQEAGFDTFISKPYSEDQIDNLLRSVP